jgi:hypothetical protein
MTMSFFQLTAQQLQDATVSPRDIVYLGRPYGEPVSIDITAWSDSDIWLAYRIADAAGNGIDISTTEVLEMKIRKTAADSTVYLDLISDQTKWNATQGQYGIYIVPPQAAPNTAFWAGLFVVFIYRPTLLAMTPGPYVQSLVMHKDNFLWDRIWSGDFVLNYGESR